MRISIEYDEDGMVQVHDSKFDSNSIKSTLYNKKHTKNTDFFYQLSNDEQRLILNFRLLSTGNQEAILRNLSRFASSKMRMIIKKEGLKSFLFIALFGYIGSVPSL